MATKKKVENSKKESKKWGGKRPGSGRKVGGENAETKRRRLLEAGFKERIAKHVDDIFNAQLNLATGTAYVYRIDEELGPKGGVKSREHVLVTDPKEIKRALDENEFGSGQVTNLYTGESKYYYVSTKPPNNSALEGLLNRYFGKVPNKLDLEDDDDSGGMNIVVVKYDGNKTTS